MIPLVVVLDACVLYPYALVDFWCTADEHELIQACWSDQILEEVRRNLPPRIPADRADKRVDAMRRALPHAIHNPPEQLIETMTNHPKDRHVLACAVTAQAGHLVTFNTKDFPTAATAHHDVEVLEPDAFAQLLVNEDPDGVLAVISDMTASRRRPPNDLTSMLDQLAARGLPNAIDQLRATLEI